MILPSERRKLESSGFIIDEPFEIDGFRYFIKSNSRNLNKQYFSAWAVEIDTGEGQTLCTRANIGTAIGKIQDHIRRTKE